MQRLLAVLVACCALVLFTFTPACGGGTGGSGGDGNADTGTIIIGVTSDLRVGVDLGQIHVVLRASGSVITDAVISAASSISPLKLPIELPFTDLAGGTPIDVTIEAFRPGDTKTPLLTRIASTEIVAGKKLLLRIAIDSRCVVAPGSSAPECAAPQTCIAGQCQSEHVDPGKLPLYSPAWATSTADVCKLAAGGTPTVIVGEGQADYLPTMDGDTAQVEAGPQGGHHIWVAVRTKNLHQSGSITSVTGHFPDLNIDVGPFNVIFTMEPDEGGYCKLYGLRFQLDQNGDITPLLGHPLDVTVTVTDTEMDIGVGKRSVVLSKTFAQ